MFKFQISLILLLIKGETNLKFIFFICKKLNPSIPSLAVLKHFVLPGFIPPKEVSISI